MTLDILFRMDLPHGRCVGVRVPPVEDVPMMACLHPAECAYLASLSPVRRPSWLAGRVALHQALGDLNLDVPAILPNPSGAPQLTHQAAGSISHKKNLAVGLAVQAKDGISVGIDIEPVPECLGSLGESGWDRRPDIRHRVMTALELEALACLSEGQQRRTVILCFSIKESLYKALNPLIRRYISFQEATVLPFSDGKVNVTLNLMQNEGPFSVEAQWSEVAGHFLTTASIRYV